MNCLSIAVFQTTNASPIVKSSATTEMIVSQTDQVFIVSATLMLKYSFTSQKPPSFTCEKIKEPAPVAIASSSGCTPVRVQRDRRNNARRRRHRHRSRACRKPHQRRQQPGQQQERNMRIAAPRRSLPATRRYPCRMRPKPPPAPTSSVIARRRRKALVAESQNRLSRESAHLAQRDRSSTARRSAAPCHRCRSSADFVQAGFPA